jgi:hypothetical protein
MEMFDAVAVFGVRTGGCAFMTPVVSTGGGGGIFACVCFSRRAGRGARGSHTLRRRLVAVERHAGSE